MKSEGWITALEAHSLVPSEMPRREPCVALLPWAGVHGPCHTWAACLHTDNSNFISPKRSWKKHLMDVILVVTLDDAQTLTEPPSWTEPWEDLTLKHYPRGRILKSWVTGTVINGSYDPSSFSLVLTLFLCFFLLFWLIFLLQWTVPSPPTQYIYSVHCMPMNIWYLLCSYMYAAWLKEDRNTNSALDCVLEKQEPPPSLPEKSLQNWKLLLW